MYHYSNYIHTSIPLHRGGKTAGVCNQITSYVNKKSKVVFGRTRVTELLVAVCHFGEILHTIIVGSGILCV